MTTPNIAELLVQQAREAERLKLKLAAVERLVSECEDLDELRREFERLNRQQ